MQALTREEFLKTEAGARAKRELQLMVASSAYSTHATYNAIVDRKLAFLDRHINYLVSHPQVSPTVYVANLRVMTKTSR